MGIIEAARGVLWARRRQPDDVVYGVALAHERFSPRELLQQAVTAENAGFDVVCCSDHLAPWWEPGEAAPAACGNAWVWLGAAGQVTSSVSLGPGVTALTHRYNPVVVAQQIATLEEMYPGRAFLGAGSGEAMNEVPAGMAWPDVAEQLGRTEEALTIITRLLDGDTVTFHGRWFNSEGARLYVRPERRPPVYLSAFGPEAARLAGRLADGVWTLADPSQAPGVIAAYRDGCAEAGREPGEIILQAVASWGDTNDAALESAREWKPTLVDANFSDDIHDPAEIQHTGEQVSDAKFTAMAMLSADPAHHVRQLKAIRAMGATAVIVMNVAGADPHAMLRGYGESVLPELRQ